MTKNANTEFQLFDEYANKYDDELNKAISVSGESKEYFAERRIETLAVLLKDKIAPEKILDFGCGDGGAVSFIHSLLNPKQIIGVDVSKESLKIASIKYSDIASASFHPIQDLKPDQSFDLAFCNGVFHHIELGEREAAFKYVYDSLREGGFFAFWENNPLNVGTRYIMRKCPFDRDAVMLSHLEARKSLRKAGFKILTTRFQFIFPRALKMLRFIEMNLSNLPIGAQYLILAQK